MAISAGIGLGDLIGPLFFGADVAADVGAGAAADVGLGAIAGGAEAGLGAADLGALGAAGADAAAGAADLGLGAADLGAAGAADVGAGAAGSAADVLGAAGTGAVEGGLPADELAALAGTLGESSAPGMDLTGALNSATLADTGGAPSAFAGTTAPDLSAGVGAAPATEGAVTPASTELASGPQAINDALGITTPPPATGPTTAQFASNLSPASEVAASSQAPAIGQLGAEGGISPQTEVALAQAGGASAAAPPGVFEGLNASSILNSPALKLGELGLPLGFLAYNAFKGPAPIPGQAQQAVQNAQQNLGPLQGEATQNVPLFNKTAAQDLNLANAFQISPSQAAALSTWKQDQYNQLLQQIANQGNSNPMSSSEWIQGKNQIDQQALAQQTQMINQLITTAFQAQSSANTAISTSANVTTQLDSTLMQAAQLQVQQDQAFQQALGSALQSFGLIAALQGRFGGSNATATT